MVMQSTQLLPHLSCVKISLSYYRELLQKLRSQQSTVEESSLLFQQARQQVLRNLRLRLHAHAITIDPKRAFRRLKDRASEARKRLTAYGMAKAQRAKTKYQAAYQRITSSSPTEAVQQRRLQELMHTNPILRVCVHMPLLLIFLTQPSQALVVGTVGTVSHVFMHALSNTTVLDGHHLAQAMHRPAGQPLITVSNHVAALDDPLVTSALLPLSSFLSPSNVRWTLCATDRCFKNAWMSSFFRAGQVLPVERGAGLEQAGIVAAEELLHGGSWVHIFPEGTRSRNGRLQPCRKGVGRLVASCAVPPLVVPFVHKGMDGVMAKCVRCCCCRCDECFMAVVYRGSKVPLPGQAVEVAVGAPVPVEDLLAAASAERWSDDELYRRIADRIGVALQRLDGRLHDRQQLEELPCIDDDALMPLIGMCTWPGHRRITAHCPRRRG